MTRAKPSFLVAAAIVIAGALSLLRSDRSDGDGLVSSTNQRDVLDSAQGSELAQPAANSLRAVHGAAQLAAPAEETQADVDESVAPAGTGGRVVDIETDAPIAGVGVHFHDGSGPARFPIEEEPDVVTDGDGHFAIEYDADGRIGATFVAPGWSPRKVVLRRFPDDHRWPLHRIRLAHAGRVLGIVQGASVETDVIVRILDYELYEDPLSSPDIAAIAVATARVGPAGHFTLDDLPSNARLNLLVEPTARGAPLLTVPEPVRLEPGETRDIRLSLDEAARIVGRAVEMDGSSATDIEVWLIASTVGRPGLVEAYWEKTATARTDGDGAFVFENVQVGTWIVGLEPHQRSTPEDSRYAAVAVPVEVAEGADEVALVIEVQRGIFVSGVVLGPDSTPRTAYITASGPAGGSHVSATTERDGTFRVGPLLAGTVRLTARPQAQRDGPSLLSPSTATEVEAGAEDVELHLRAGCAVTLRAVSVSDDRAVPATFHLGYPSGELGFRFSVQTKEEETFDSLEPGILCVRAETPDGRSGIVEAFELEPGQHLTDLRVPLTESGTIRIRFLRGAGVLGSTIYRADAPLSSNGVYAGGEHRALFPPGRVRIRLVLREQTAAGSLREVHSEERIVHVVAGEETIVVFER